MSAFVRLIRASWAFAPILVSYVVQLGLERVLGEARVRGRWRGLHERNAGRLYRGMVRLRGVFIKMGQVLSIMGTFLPRAFAKALEPLQDRVPPRPIREMARAFTSSIGRPPSEVFERFDEESLAAASLGQVHRAWLPGGEAVAVKILYPDIETIIRVDLIVMRWAMRVYRWFVPIQTLPRILDQLRDLLARETDYVNEAHCLERMAANSAGDPDLLFPAVHWPLTTRNVLTMTFMPGIKISRREELEAAGIEPEAVARKLVETFCKQLFVDGFFHADPHPGNFLVQRHEGSPRIVLLDFGASSEAHPGIVNGMLEILRGIVGRDDALVVRGIETMGFVAKDGDRALLERTIKLYFQKLLDLDITDFSRIKPDVARRFADPEVKREELRELMKSVEYPDGWFFVERAVLILFGLSAQLAPRMSALQVGFPYVMQKLAEARPAG